MKNYLTLHQAAKRLETLCKAINAFNACKLPTCDKVIEEYLRSGNKVLWISKYTGLVYTEEPNYLPNYLCVDIIWHLDDKYEIELS